MTRVVIITHEPIAPLMAGRAIRALEMARALADSVEPTIATPYPVTRELPAGVSAATYAFGDERSLAKILADAETVIIQGFHARKISVAGRDRHLDRRGSVLPIPVRESRAHALRRD